MKRVQQALAAIGIPVMAGVWRSDSITQSSPEQYVVYSTTMSEYAHEDDAATCRRTFVYMNLWSNPGCVFAEPVITVYGSGDITLMVGTQIVELTGITDSITLDTPAMEAYSGTTSMDSHMRGEFPTLDVGATAISWSGSVSQVVVQPNWRTL